MSDAKKKASPRRRWACPTCEHTHLAPGGMRKVNLLRYCVPCSQQAGKLIERVCAAAERKRSAGKARSAVKQSAKRKRVAGKRAAHKAARSRVVHGVNCRAEVARQINKAEIFAPLRGRRITTEVDWRKGRGRLGYAVGSWRIVVYGNRARSADCVRQTITHELVHCLNVRTEGWPEDLGGRRIVHGERFKRTLVEAARQLYRVDVGWAERAVWRLDSKIVAAVQARRDR